MSFRKTAAALLAFALLAPAAQAQLAVSANDAKVRLENGVTLTNAHPAPDTAVIIDLDVFPPRVLATVAAPASVIGPPQSVAIAPDESFALVTGATRIDPSAPGKTVPNDALSVIDLKTRKVVATLHAEQGASGVSISRDGKLAIVANRAAGTVLLYAVHGLKLTLSDKIALGDSKSGPSHADFTPDGKLALVTRDGDNRIAAIVIDGGKFGNVRAEMSAGVRPYGMVIRPQGDYAIVANIGATPGDYATLSFIDLNWLRVVNTVTVGPTPEGLALSRDGRFLAVTIMNGSNQPSNSPYFNRHGLLNIYRVEGKSLELQSTAEIGHWCQGAVWNRDATVLLVQCAADNEIEIFHFDGKATKRDGAILVTGPAGIRTAD